MPHKVIAITDTGAQATVMGEEHLKDIGMDRFSLYPTTVTMDCPNNMRLKALGVFFGYIRARCSETWDVLLHRGMVYVVKGGHYVVIRVSFDGLRNYSEGFPTSWSVWR